MGLETRIFENLTVRFSRTRPTGQRGPPLEMNHFSGKFPPGPHCSIYVPTEISGNFGVTESTLCLNYILIEPHFIILTKCSISTVNACLADTLLLRKPLLLWTGTAAPENIKNYSCTENNSHYKDFVYYGQQIVVPMVSVMTRVDCIGGQVVT